MATRGPRGPGRTPRQKQARGRSMVGERYDVEVGPVAHGGHFIARVPLADGSLRVVFVRHALPGEQVTLEITEGTEGDRFWRGDAIAVTTPSADRVEAPCRFAGPGACGGCDFQHVSLKAQRALKTAVVREQFARIAKLDVDVEVEPAPREKDGLHWRTRVEYAVAPDGSQGMRRHRSRSVVPVDTCLIAAPDARVAGTGGPLPVLEHVETSAGSHDFAVAADGFWQVHPAAPKLLTETVLDFLAPQAGERALDLYSGVGLFAAFLAEAVGERGRVVAIEGDRLAAEHAKGNLAAYRHAKSETGSVDRVLATAFDEPFDLVVLDPPREGAKRAVVEQIVDRAPRAVAYVACDPAALARDVAIFAEHGYTMSRIRSFDLFPMTHHVECVALLTKT